MARDFNGTTNRIDWSAVTNLTGSAVTVSAWVYFDAYAAHSNYILCIHQSGDAAIGIVFLIQADGSIQFYRAGATALFHNSNTAIGTGAWVHVLATHTGLFTDRSTILLYKSGVDDTLALSGSDGATEANATGSWSVGGRIFDDSRNSDAKIGELAVWNAVLDGTTITALANGELPSAYSTNLVYYYSSRSDTVVAETGGTGTADGSAFTTAHPKIQFPVIQNNQAQTSDAASVTVQGGGATNITVAQNNQAQVSNAAVLGVFTPVAPSQQAQAQVSNIAVLGVYTPITPSQQNQAQVSDAAVLGVFVPVTAAQNNQAQVSDAAVLGVYTVITPSQQAQAQVSDIAVISAGEANIAGAQNNQAQVFDAAVITVSNPFVVDDIILEWVPDLANISPAQNNQAQVSDVVSLGVYTPITPSQQNQAQVSDAVSLTAQAPTYNITVAQNNQAQVSDAVTFSSIVYPLTAAENNQAQQSDLAVLLFGEIGLSAAENRQAQVSDAAIFSAEAPTWNISAAENHQAQIIDPVSLTVIYILAAIENHQAQVSDLAVVTVGGVFEHGERQLYEFATRSNLTMATRANLEVND